MVAGPFPHISSFSSQSQSNQNMCSNPSSKLLSIHLDGLMLQAEISEIARENSIIMKSFPSHTTHLLQPCDLHFFARFKANFDREVLHATRKLQTATPIRIQECWDIYHFRVPTTTPSPSTLIVSAPIDLPLSKLHLFCNASVFGAQEDLQL